MSQQSQRPLSPHISIYKPQITSVLSILHRITGVGLAFSLIFFVWFFVSLASGIDSYNCFVACVHHPIGYTLLSLVVFGLSYHLCNGIRHLAWDAGYGYHIKTVTKTGVFVLCASVILSIVVLTAMVVKY